MSLIEIKQKNFDKAIKKLDLLRKRGLDTKPVLEKFLEDMKESIGNNYSAQGAPFGGRWQGLSAKYKTWKRKHYGSGKADLVLTGKLRRAATGDKSAGWYDKINKNFVEWGIQGIEYAQYHQFGTSKMPQRVFFLPKDNQLPGRVVTNLILNLDKYLMDGVAK